jgi:hypothetical protein
MRPGGLARLAGAVWLSVTAGLADPPAVMRAGPLPGWDAKFRRTDGWVGSNGC